jgi:hypothetical protein
LWLERRTNNEICRLQKFRISKLTTNLIERTTVNDVFNVKRFALSYTHFQFFDHHFGAVIENRQKGVENFRYETWIQQFAVVLPRVTVQSDQSVDFFTRREEFVQPTFRICVRRVEYDLGIIWMIDHYAQYRPQPCAEGCAMLGNLVSDNFDYF